MKTFCIDLVFALRRWRTSLRNCVVRTLIITCSLAMPGIAINPVFIADTVSGAGTVRGADDRAPGIVDRVIASSKEHLGKPYKFRNEYGRTMDCGGFISYVWSLHGVVLPPSSRDIAHQVERVPMDAVEKGDLLFFKGRRTFLRRVGHVSMIVDRKGSRVRMIHSCSRGVVIDDYPTEYYSRRFLFAGRIPRLPGKPEHRQRLSGLKQGIFFPKTFYTGRIRSAIESRLKPCYAQEHAS